MNANVDLRQLAVRRQESPAITTTRPRHLLSRYLLPGVILLGFLAVAGWAARDSLLQSKPVTVVPVLATRSEMQQEGTPLFQAAGWVEPRPTPIVVTALTEGVIDKLLVVENQEVKAGEPVATLIDADARLGLKTAEADLRLRKAEVTGARASCASTSINLAQLLSLQAALAEAEAMLAQKETDSASLPFQLRIAKARLNQARFNLEKKRNSEGVTPEIAVEQARNEEASAQAAVEEIETRSGRLKREIEAQKQRRDALQQRLELKTEETRQREEAEAMLDAAEARQVQAQVALDTARLRLERTTVRAPSAGRVLALVGRPGMRMMGLAPGSLQESSTVVTLYDPASLQVRADVRLEDVPRVRPGQKVRIETPAAPGGALDGEVLFSTSQADIQKNTLQVKVAIKSPPATIRPDMLVQVTFLAAAVPGPAHPSETLRLLIPRQLVETEGSGARVWIADQAAGTARQRSVKLGAVSGEFVEVVEGLNPADRLISGGRDGLREGERITVTGEEAAGSAHQTAPKMERRH